MPLKYNSSFLFFTVVCVAEDFWRRHTLTVFSEMFCVVQGSADELRNPRFFDVQRESSDTGVRSQPLEDPGERTISFSLDFLGLTGQG
jgi:hypothetical protein